MAIVTFYNCDPKDAPKTTMPAHLGANAVITCRGRLCCVSMGSIHQKKALPAAGHLFFGGVGGSRTPVRRQLGKNFSGCSLLFTFPRPSGNKHPMGLGSFMIHGVRKA